MSPESFYSNIAYYRWESFLRQKGYDREYVELLERQLPETTPLLDGTIQPADFVKNFVDKYESDYVFSPPTSTPPPPAPIFTARASLASTRELFYFAVQKQHFFLGARKSTFTDINERFVLLIIVSLTLFTFLLFFSVIFNVSSVFATLDDLSFASVLLLGPILASFSYSKLMQDTHQKLYEIKIMRTRLASASHAYETYEEIKRLQRRIQAQKDVENQDRQIKQEQALSNELRRNEIEMQKLLQRAEAIQMVEQMLNIQRFSQDNQLELIKILLQYPNLGEDDLADDKGKDYDEF